MKFNLIPNGNRKPVSVDADYYSVTEQGTLVFRSVRSRDYPLTVHTFAKDAWREVVLEQEGL